MDAKLLVDSKMMIAATFGAEGIPREPLVTIESITREEQDKKTKEKWGIFHFSEPWAKPLKANRHSQQCCIAMFGSDTDKWIGKRLLLYACPGTYFGEVGVAVRIKGSPDITAPISVSVKKRGNKKPDVYNLMPTNGTKSNGTPKAEPPPYVPGVVWWGKSKGLQIAALTAPELTAQADQYTKWLETAKPSPATTTTRTNLDELLAEEAHRVEIERAMDAGQPPAGAPQTSAEEAPPT